MLKLSFWRPERAFQFYYFTSQQENKGKWSRAFALDHCKRAGLRSHDSANRKLFIRLWIVRGHQRPLGIVRRRLVSHDALDVSISTRRVAIKVTIRGENFTSRTEFDVDRFAATGTGCHVFNILVGLERSGFNPSGCFG
ncbi:MAG: hypothetical protein SGJ27_26875 [Candidatus Melainabacteria bacterium]|nr:hypothetical protein [Candidatus Melainabacteria bacterium]